MGWLDEAVSDVGSGISNVVSGAGDLVKNPGAELKEIWNRGGKTAANILFPGTMLMPDLFAETKQPDAISGNANQDEMIKAQQAELEKFQANRPQYEQDMFSNIMSKAKRNIAQGQSQSEKAFNRRGLLYSGLKQKEEGDIAARGAAQASEQKFQASEGLRAQQKQMEETLQQMREGKYRQQLSEADAAYRRVVAEQQARGDALGGFFGMAGTVAGGLMGGPAGAMAGGTVGSTVGKQLV